MFSVIDVHNIPCNWCRGAAASAVAEVWRLPNRALTRDAEATPASLGGLSPSYSQF